MKRLLMGLVGMIPAFLAWGDPEAVRTWTSQSGAILEARLLRVDGPHVVLQSADGRQFQVQSVQLSAADQAYLKERGLTPAASPTAPAPVPAPPPAGDLKPEWAPGEIAGPVECRNAADYHYFAYVPQSLAPGEPVWPVMFVMSPGGGNAGGLKRYLPAAELNGVMLFLSKESRNNADDADRAMRAMVEDVLRRVPRADPGFTFSSGFSGGCRMAFMAADNFSAKLKGGVLACGAATHSHTWSPPAQLPIYGLSGTRCFNRWDMACLMEKNSETRCLRFFSGAHAWADDERLRDGLTWLLSRAHARSGKTGPGKAAAERWAARVLEWTQTQAAADPVRTWRYLELLQFAVPASPTAGSAARIRTDLQSNPGVQSALAADKDIEAFWRKHFKTDPMDYVNHNETEAAAKDGARYAAAYKGTPYETLFAEMGQGTANPLKKK